MRQLPRFVLTLAPLLLGAALVAGVWWIVTHLGTSQTTAKSAAPATVDKVVKEEELNTITLTEEAEKRIGLAVAPVEKKSVRRVRVYGGEVIVPVGRSIIVAAPLGGTLKSPASGEVKAGQTVKAGHTVFQLIPVLTPEGRANLSAALADAEGLMNNAGTQVESTKIARERAKRVSQAGAGSQRQVDEAQAAYDLAAQSQAAATARHAILKKVVGDAQSGFAQPMAINAPTAGIIRTISALPGQTVPNGAALFEVADVSTAWVRVALPVGDLDTIDRTAPAQVGKLAASPSAVLATAKPVAAPPSANPLSTTVDVYYELPNADQKLIPGQRLGVTVPLADAKESSTVPWSAVVFDINGGTWVYEQVGEHRYTRKRVTVGYTVGNDAVLASGPSVGTKVVVAGVQQIFGAETGFVK